MEQGWSKGAGPRGSHESSSPKGRPRQTERILLSVDSFTFPEHRDLAMRVTVGAEEELQVVAVQGHPLTAHHWDGAQAPCDQFATEIHQCVIEVKTPIEHRAQDVVRQLARLRQEASRRAALQDQCILAAGTHPFSCWTEQSVYGQADTHPHYARLLEEYGDIARSAMTFGMHLHLGLADPRYHMAVMNGLRELLPDLLALTVSAPFCDARTTGLQSWRHSLLGRYPRMGIPEAWVDEEAYTHHRDRLRQHGCIGPQHGLWEDMRLHHVYPTIEIRIADSHPDLARYGLALEMALREVAVLVDELDRGRDRTPLSRALIEENKWRARRYGPRARLVDWREDTEQSWPERLAGWCARWSGVNPPECRPQSAFEQALMQAAAAPSSADVQLSDWARRERWGDVTAGLIEATHDATERWA